ncbi:hypothetical protein ACIRRX_20770 [Streptomyces bacillaris]
MTAPLQAIAAGDGSGRWSWPISPPRDNTAVTVRPVEARAVADLGVRNLRRLQHHDSSASAWRAIARLLVPLEAVNAALDSPPTPHRRRAMLDVVAVLLTRSAETGRTFWGWTEEEWFHLLGRTQAELKPRARTRHRPGSSPSGTVAHSLVGHRVSSGHFWAHHQAVTASATSNAGPATGERRSNLR